MGKMIGRLMKWIDTNIVETIAPPFAIYYTSPGEVKPEEMVYDRGIPIKENVNGEGDIEIVDIPKYCAISAIHKCPYPTLPDAYMEVWEYLVKNDYEAIGTLKEVYYNDPKEVSPEELITEIQFPIK